MRPANTPSNAISTGLSKTKEIVNSDTKLQTPAKRSLSSLFPEITPTPPKPNASALHIRVLEDGDDYDTELLKLESSEKIEPLNSSVEALINMPTIDKHDSNTPSTLDGNDQNDSLSSSAAIPITTNRKRSLDETLDEPEVSYSNIPAEPQTPTGHRNKRVRPRTPQSVRVISADTYFPSIGLNHHRGARTPTHRTPRTLNPYFSAPTAGGLTTPSTPTVYSLAKALFQRGSNSREVVGRGMERAALERFLNERLETKGKGALYLSGLPGTGKSALLSEVVERRALEYSKRFTVKVATINCMTVENASDIFTMIHQELTQGEEDDEDESDLAEYEDGEGETMISGDGERLTLDRGKRLIIEDLERRILRQPASSQTRHIIVLDELDHIMTKDQEVLFRIFQWAFAANSSLILFGIANALDLTDRFLPRLRSNSLTPQLLAFKPYTAPEIAHIIEERLWSLVGGRPNNGGRPGSSTGDPSTANSSNMPPLMHPAAIQLCARKTASNTGDLRKAFDLCRRAIETVEEGVRRQKVREVLKQPGGGGAGGTGGVDGDNMPQGRGSPGLAWKRALVNGSNSQTLTVLTLETAPRVTISHVAKVCSSAFGGTMAQRIKVLNLQQKAVLCVLVVGERQSSNGNSNSNSNNNSNHNMGSNNSTTATTSQSESSATATSASAGSGKLTVVRLFDRYTTICMRDKVLSQLPFADFLDVVSALESNGVVNISGVCGRKGQGTGGSRSRSSKGGGGASGSRFASGVQDNFSQRRITANVHQIDLMSAVGATPLLRSFLVDN